jgi:hypothetical protein
VISLKNRLFGKLKIKNKKIGQMIKIQHKRTLLKSPPQKNNMDIIDHII